MKQCLAFLFLGWATCLAQNQQLPSTIQKVTVYLSGAQITRTVKVPLKEGANTVTLTHLSTKVDESSIQLSGLGAVSIRSMAFDRNYLETTVKNPEVEELERQIKDLDLQMSRMNHTIDGLEEEERIITTNRMVSSDQMALDLNKVKEISQYYRERITAIKNEIFGHRLQISNLKEEAQQLRQQITEINSNPVKETGELTVTFDAPVATQLQLTVTYMVSGAGWVPQYDIKSEQLNAPVQLTYKANVYQNTGQDWKNTPLILSTETPQPHIAKPQLEPHYLNFTTRYAQRNPVNAVKKQGYAFNPNIKKVVGTVTDPSGLALPGVNVTVKGTTSGTQTDFDGNYALDVAYGQELQFSYIGMRTEEIPLYSSIINVAMDEDATALEEVVVTGYATGTINNLTGAVSSISADQLVQGKVAGVNIRGASSFRGRATDYTEVSPIYIIDGVTVDSFEEGDLDENEIENITILKGAEATAIYGSRGNYGVVVITTKKSEFKKDSTQTQFVIKKPYSIVSDGDATVIAIDTFSLPATYEYFAAPILNENVFLTATLKDWEKHQLLPGEANIYFEGTYAGKTVLDPYTTKKEMVLSLGMDPNISVSRTQDRNFKSRSFTGNQRILDRTYVLEVKNNKNVEIDLKLMDRIPQSQNKEIRVDGIDTHTADYQSEKGLLSWKMTLAPQATKTKRFSFQVKYPKGRYISL